MDSRLFVVLNSLLGFYLGYLASPKKDSINITNIRLNEIIDFLTIESLDRKLCEYYSNRYLTLAGLSLTSLAIYFSWNINSITVSTNLIFYLFLSTLVFLISSQVVLEAQQFILVWLSELFHYFGVLVLLYGIGSFIQETFRMQYLIVIVPLTIFLFIMYVYKLVTDLRKNIITYLKTKSDRNG